MSYFSPLPSNKIDYRHRSLMARSGVAPMLPRQRTLESDATCHVQPCGVQHRGAWRRCFHPYLIVLAAIASGDIIWSGMDWHRLVKR